MGTLSGQVGIVTGGSRGIGRSVAEALSSHGMSIALLARSAGQLQEAKSSCEALGGRAIAVPVDVSDAEALAEAVERIDRDLGPVDLLVNNAGVQGPPESLWDAGFDAWWDVVQVNLGGALAGAAAVLPGMVARGRGRLVHMNSLVGARDEAQYGAYAVSKAAMLRLGGVLATSLAGTGVTVLDVSPGLVRTAMTENMPRLRGLPDDAWTPVEKVASLLVAVAHGQLDFMSGRFVHAQEDWTALSARAEELVRGEGRALRLTRGWAEDPLFS